VTERDPGRDALVTWAIALVLVAVLLRINFTLPWIGNVGSALVAVLFLYAPVVVGWRRGEELEDYGFKLERPWRDLGYALGAISVIFPLFALGYFAFYEIACHSHLLAHLVPRQMCSQYGGLGGLHAPNSSSAWTSSWDFAEFCLSQLVVVALPEELFFRGFLLGLLEKKFPPKRRLLGGGVGLALVLSSAAFALIHLPKYGGDPRELATFFPGLLFGWMRSATGSIAASTVTHGCSNILIRLLDLSVLR
jgi:membrane protease YdiL (CAAX protease family)